MHNLYLGTGKHMFSIWVKRGILSNQDLKKINDLISKFVVPSNIGRLPVGMKSNYAKFKAEQWSTWINIIHPLY